MREKRAVQKEEKPSVSVYRNEDGAHKNKQNKSELVTRKRRNTTNKDSSKKSRQKHKHNDRIRDQPNIQRPNKNTRNRKKRTSKKNNTNNRRTNSTTRKTRKMVKQ